MRWFRVWRARVRVRNLEAAIEWHTGQAQDHQRQLALALRALRKERADLAAMDCPVQALRLVMGYKRRSS
jgi:hypothetical protein